MFVTGPEVVKTVTHEDVTAEELGGAVTHTTQVRRGRPRLRERRRGAARCCAASSTTCRSTTARSRRCGRPTIPPTALELSLDTLVPDNPNKPYDMKELIVKVVDDGDFFELQPDYAKNIVIGFARMDGRPVGIVANQPLVLAGCLDIKSSHQGGALRALLRLPSTSRSSPSSTCPGFLPGTAQEYGGIIKHGAKLLYAYAEATVPKVTVITRKAYGGAYDVMSSKHLRGDVNFAWPTRRDRGDGAQGRGRDHLPRGQGRPGQDRGARAEEYKAKFANPFVAGARGFIDDVIMPHDTRRRICRSLAMLRDKRLENPWRKHGNIPL